MYSIMTDARRLPLFDLQTRRDPTAARHGGQETSQSAHKRVLPYKRGIFLAILKLYRQAGSLGLTAKDVAYQLGKQLNEISGRITELRQMGFIHLTPGKRLNSRVLVHRRYARPPATL